MIVTVLKDMMKNAVWSDFQFWGLPLWLDDDRLLVSEKHKHMLLIYLEHYGYGCGAKSVFEE